MVLASWQKLANPKVLRRLGFKKHFLLLQGFGCKKCVGDYSGSGLWAQITKEKYFPHESIIDWIQNPNK
jgi:hypothetical protein